MTATTEAPQVDVATCMTRLNHIAWELDELSKSLADVERKLEPLQRAFDDDFADWEAGMFARYESGEGKWPGEETRIRLYRRTMPADGRETFDKYHASRKRMEKRIGTLGKAADAQRSVLSALKTEMEATR